MSPYRETLDASSGFFEKCARHSNRHTTRSIQHIYLCEDCVVRMVREVFNDRPPLYHGETVEGYCGLCNERKQVTLRQWFVCPICWNVVVAYQKSFVASQAVHDYWNAAGLPKAFILRETEEVYLSPFFRGAKTKKQAAESLEHLDFLVLEDDEPVFHIELKSGPTAAHDMREFQLDVNDFNDIVGAVRHTGLPAYVFHVQLDQKYEPPTRYTVAVGMWWTDPRTLRTHLNSVKARRGEDKRAAYFNPAAFRPWGDFPGELASRRFEELAASDTKDPIEYLE